MEIKVDFFNSCEITLIHYKESAHLLLSILLCYSGYGHLELSKFKDRSRKQAGGKGLARSHVRIGSHVRGENVQFSVRQNPFTAKNVNYLEASTAMKRPGV